MDKEILHKSAHKWVTSSLHVILEQSLVNSIYENIIRVNENEPGMTRRLMR